jgi:hypothetical protein
MLLQPISFKPDRLPDQPDFYIMQCQIFLR